MQLRLSDADRLWLDQSPEGTLYYATAADGPSPETVLIVRPEADHGSVVDARTITLRYGFFWSRGTPLLLLVVRIEDQQGLAHFYPVCFNPQHDPLSRTAIVQLASQSRTRLALWSQDSLRAELTVANPAPAVRDLLRDFDRCPGSPLQAFYETLSDLQHACPSAKQMWTLLSPETPGIAH